MFYRAAYMIYYNGSCNYKCSQLTEEAGTALQVRVPYPACGSISLGWGTNEQPCLGVASFWERSCSISLYGKAEWPQVGNGNCIQTAVGR